MKLNQLNYYEKEDLFKSGTYSPREFGDGHEIDLYEDIVSIKADSLTRCPRVVDIVNSNDSKDDMTVVAEVMIKVPTEYDGDEDDEYLQEEEIESYCTGMTNVLSNVINSGSVFNNEMADPLDRFWIEDWIERTMDQNKYKLGLSDGDYEVDVLYRLHLNIEK